MNGCTHVTVYAVNCTSLVAVQIGVVITSLLASCCCTLLYEEDAAAKDTRRQHWASSTISCTAVQKTSSLAQSWQIDTFRGSDIMRTDQVTNADIWGVFAPSFDNIQLMLLVPKVY